MNRHMVQPVRGNTIMIDFLLHDFMGRALLAGIGLGSVSAVMGCFLVWRRMAFFGDAMGHAAVLGVALGTLLNLNVYLFIMVAVSYTHLDVYKRQKKYLGCLSP